MTGKKRAEGGFFFSSKFQGLRNNSFTHPIPLRKVKEKLVDIWALISCLLLLLSRFSRVRLCATPEMAAHQAPPPLGFSRQEHWSGLPFSPPMHESEREVAQSCPTLCDPRDGSSPGSPRPWDSPGKNSFIPKWSLFLLWWCDLSPSFQLSFFL